MIVSEHFPSAPLNTYVSVLRYSEGPTAYQHLNALPVPHLSLMINFSDAYRCYREPEARPYLTCTKSWAVGMWNAHHILDWPRSMQLFVVDFRPGGAYPLLHVPLSELHNDIVPLDAIWGKLAAEFRERLYAAPTVQARFALLEQLLIDRLSEMPVGLQEVQHAVARIAGRHGALSIRGLSDEIGVSHNHLIRQFNQLVGATPKELARIVRFRHALSRVDPSDSIDWTEIAFQAGYYDQSHFIKDFKAYIGHTPTDFLQLHRQVHIDHQTLPPDYLPTG